MSPDPRSDKDGTGIRLLALRERLRRRTATRWAAGHGWRLWELNTAALRLLYGRPLRPSRGESCRLPDWCDDESTFDHPEALMAGRECVGIVVHLYEALVLASVPPHLVIDQLPVSWYRPGVTNAFVYRRAAA